MLKYYLSQINFSITLIFIFLLIIKEVLLLKLVVFCLLIFLILLHYLFIFFFRGILWWSTLWLLLNTTHRWTGSLRLGFLFLKLILLDNSIYVMFMLSRFKILSFIWVKRIWIMIAVVVTIVIWTIRAILWR